MNLSGIIEAALSILERSQDPTTVEAYKNQFTLYANDAVAEITRRFPQARLENVALADKAFTLSSLSRECVKVLGVSDGSTQVYYNQDVKGSGTFVCDTDAETVSVHYEFAPAELVDLTDTPELPARFTQIIPYYVVGCARASAGDSKAQGAANVYYSLFERKLRTLIRSSHRGEPESYKLLNY